MDYYGDLRPLDGSISGSLSQDESISGSLAQIENLSGSLTVQPVGPTSVDYNTQVDNKPKINTVTVEGEKLGADYNLQDKMARITEQEIDRLIYGG